MKDDRFKIELVAPAGGPHQLIAAINAGADSVYLAYRKYGARAYAKNFSFEGLGWAAARAHGSGKKIYLTINTIIKNEEVKDLVNFLNNYLAVCQDGVIIQDMGLFKILKDLYPKVPVHASTQLNIHNSSSIDFAESCGFSRVVLAREMTLVEIKDLSRKNGVKIEVFGHGSQCYSFSGICYFSSFTGGRSGNRGRCTQPCRMKYMLAGNSGKKARMLTKKPSFLISKNDLCTLGILPDLIDSGIDALKIEGRMKTPEYVAVIVKIYRKYIDLYYDNPESYKVEEEDLLKISQIFSRGLGTGYYEGSSRDIVDPDRSGSIGNFIGRIKRVRSGKKGEMSSINVASRLPVRGGDILEVWTKKGNKRIEISDLRISGSNEKYREYEIEVEDEKIYSPKDRVFKYFDKKLDEEAKSLFKYESVEAGRSSEYKSGIHEKDRLRKYLERHGIKKQTPDTKYSENGRISITLRIYSLEELAEAVKTAADNIIISNPHELLNGKIANPGNLIKEIVDAGKVKRIIIDTPEIIYDSKMELLKKQLVLLCSKLNIWLRVSNLGVLGSISDIQKAAGSSGSKVMLGGYLNISNALSLSFYEGILDGAAGWEFSPELDTGEIDEAIRSFRNTRDSGFIFSVFAHGFFKVMTARHLLRYPDKKNDYAGGIYLLDRKNYRFRLLEDGRGNTGIYNSKKICTIFDLDKLVESRINDLVVDSIFTGSSDAARIIRSYREALDILAKKGHGNYKEYIETLKEDPLFMDYSRGHLFRGVE